MYLATDFPDLLCGAALSSCPAGFPPLHEIVEGLTHMGNQSSGDYRPDCVMTVWESKFLIFYKKNTTTGRQRLWFVLLVPLPCVRNNLARTFIVQNGAREVIYSTPHSLLVLNSGFGNTSVCVIWSDYTPKWSWVPRIPCALPSRRDSQIQKKSKKSFLRNFAESKQNPKKLQKQRFQKFSRIQKNSKKTPEKLQKNSKKTPKKAY